MDDDLVVRHFRHGKSSCSVLQDGMLVHLNFRADDLAAGDILTVQLAGGQEQVLIVDATEDGSKYLAYSGPRAALHFNYDIIDQNLIKVIIEAHQQGLCS